MTFVGFVDGKLAFWRVHYHKVHYQVLEGVLLRIRYPSIDMVFGQISLWAYALPLILSDPFHSLEVSHTCYKLYKYHIAPLWGFL